MINITSRLICDSDSAMKLLRLKPEEEATNLEMVCKKYFDEQNITLAQNGRSQFTVKSGTDKSRWSQGDSMNPFAAMLQKFGLLSKYPTEILHAKCFCGMDDAAMEIELNTLKTYDWKK